MIVAIYARKSGAQTNDAWFRRQLEGLGSE
jgi:hypothetical protein